MELRSVWTPQFKEVGVFKGAPSRNRHDRGGEKVLRVT